MEITWHGHSCFVLEGSKRVLIDPFITDNPSAKVGPEELSPELLLITHGHEDHIGDAVDIARRAKPRIGVIHEIASYLQERGIEAEGMNIYGSLELDGVKVTLVPALHSSSYANRYMGDAGGYIVEMDGAKLYHAGDTGIFGDMELIGELFAPEAMFVPVGGRYTMNAEVAARAVELISPRVAIPMHYATFPILASDASEFKRLVEERGKTKVVVLESGESYEL